MDIQELDEKNYYSIKQASEMLGVETYLLRFWEDELKIHVLRTDTGRRIYQKEDLLKFQKVIESRNSGIKLKDLKRQYQIEKFPTLEDKEKLNPCTRNRTTYQELTQCDHIDNGKVQKSKKSSRTNISTRSNYNKYIQNNSPIETNAFGENNSQFETSTFGESNSPIETSTFSRNNSPFENNASIESHTCNKKENLEVVETKELVYEKEMEQKLQKLEELLGKVFTKAMETGTQEMMDQMTENVKETISKELDYQFRMKDDKDQEWYDTRKKQEEEWLQKQEEHFQKLDELLRAGRKSKRKKEK